MSAVLYILLGWALAAAGCYAAGALLFARLRLEWSRQEAIALRFVAGAALYSTLVFLYGIAHLYYRAVFVATPLLLLLAAWRGGALALPRESLSDLPLLWRRVLCLSVPFTVLYFANALAPETSPDGSSYHLGLVAKYYRERAMVPVTMNLYAALSQGMEMLFLAAYAVGRHSAAALMHFSFLLALPWLLVCYGRRYQMPAAGVTAALLVYCAPVVGIDGISAYNDVASACVLFALFTVLRRLEAEPEQRNLVIAAGILCGFAYGIKYTLFPALLLSGAWVVWIYRRQFLRPALTLAASAAPLIAPWVLRNTVWWHNPLAPFFNNWFPNPFVQYSFEVEYRRHLAMYSLKSYAQIPLEVTVNGDQLNGLLGPVFLLTPLALLALRSAEGRRLLLAALCFLATYPSNIGTRFLIPAIPFVAFALAQTLASGHRAISIAALAVHAVLSWPSIIPRYASPWAWRLDKVPWKQALRLRSEDEYILSRLPSYAITRRLEELVPEGRRIMGFGQIPEAYTNRDFFVAFQSAPGNTLRDTFLTALIKERQATLRLSLKFPAGRYRAVRAVQTLTELEAPWSVTELRIFNKDHEVPRSPLWRLRANPVLHDVQRAFDNSYVTRWMVGAAQKNMYLEVDFGRFEPVDEMVILMSPDQPWNTIQVEVQGPSGAWTRVKSDAKPQEVTTPLGMRRAAVEELLRREVGYLIINSGDFGYNDLILNRNIWGVEELANMADFRLYRLIPRDEMEAAKKK